MPLILDLPTELLIKILADLDVWDLGSCLLTCRRLKAIIQDTCILQYLIRTALAGVHDPLFQSGFPLTDRLESLKRWSGAWHQPGAYLRSPSRVLTPTTSKSSTDLILCDDYLVALDFGGRQGYRHVAGYEWLDLRNLSDGWAKIQFEENLIPLAVALDTDEDLLATLFGCPEYATFQLRLLDFHDGSPHLLASQPCVDIALPTEETHYIGLKTHMSMMGPYIIVAAGLPPEGTGIDVLILVDWQKGHVTTVYTRTRTYLTDFLVLSDDILALIRGPENAIELCRIDTTNSTASLQTIHLLELPPLVSYACLTSASLKTESNPNKSTAHLPSRRRSPHRPPPRHSFSPSPTEALMVLTLTAKITGSAFVDTRTYNLAVHARTLLSYASPSSHAPRSSLPPAVPWDTWGPPATRCFEAPTSWSSPSSSTVVVAGQRWLDIKSGAIRDFCPHHVRRAPATNTGTGVPMVGLGSSTLPAGRVFACDIESALPYREISLEMDDSDSSFVVEDAMIDMDRVVFLTGSNRDQITVHVHTVG